MTTRPAMEIRYKPDALYHAYKTVRLEDKLGEDMTDQKRRIEDKLPTEPLDWEDPEVKAAKEHTRLANAMAKAGAELLKHTNTAAALAAIPNTAPQQYVVAGTLAMIAKVLPGAAVSQPAGDLPPLPEPWQHFPSAPEGSRDHFAADQMRDYTRAAIAAHLAQQDSDLRRAVQQMAHALADGEWADLLTTDDDAAALEAQIQKLVERAHLASQSQAAQPSELTQKVKDALTLAMTICDAVPTRAHDLAEDESLKHLGVLVNYQESTGQHGYALIRDALSEVAAHLVGQSKAGIPEGAAIDGNGTAYHNVAEIYYQAECAECMHMWLDDRKVPRADADGKVYSLVGRAAQLVAGQSQATKVQADELLSLHRHLAAEKLRADQGWERAEAKSKECIELRERMAAAKVQAVPEGWTVERVGEAIHIKRADGRWTGFMPSISPAHALTYEFLSAMLTAPTAQEVTPAASEVARDGCKMCLGAKGGVPGNENVVGGVVVCDYCSSTLMDMKAAGWFGSSNSAAQEVTQQAALEAPVETILREALLNIRDYRTDVDNNIAARSMRFHAEMALENATALVTQQAAKAETAEQAPIAGMRWSPSAGQWQLTVYADLPKIASETYKLYIAPSTSTVSAPGSESSMVSYNLLPDMTYSMAGVPVGSPAWHARSGWNSAVIHLGDRLRPAVSAPDEIRNAALEEAAQACDGERVEDTGTDGDTGYNSAITHCAVAIRALRTVSTAGAQNAEAIRNALQPFADLAELFDDGRRGGTMPDSGPVMTWPRVNKEYVLTVEHLRAARAALQSGTASTKTGEDNG